MSRLLLVWISLAGCAGETPGQPDDLQAEIDAIGEVVGGAALWRVVSAVVVVALLAWLQRRATRWLQSRRLLSATRLARVGNIATVLTILAAGWYLLASSLTVAPLLTVVLLVVALMILGASAVGTVQDLMAGATISAGGRIAAGDHLEVQGRSGVVVRLGPLSTQIRGEDGSLLYLPNRLLLREPFSTRSPDRTALVRVTRDLKRAVTADDRERARRAALLCPYRRQGSPVTVTGDATGELRVSFRSPSDELARRAADYLDAMLAAPEGQRPG